MQHDIHTHKWFYEHDISIYIYTYFLLTIVNNTIPCDENQHIGYVKKRQESDKSALKSVTTSLLGPKVKMKDWVSKWLLAELPGKRLDKNKLSRCSAHAEGNKVLLAERLRFMHTAMRTQLVANTWTWEWNSEPRLVFSESISLSCFTRNRNLNSCFSPGEC